MTNTRRWEHPVSVLTTGLDVSALVTWIEAIPLTEWPAGDLTQLRPAMVTDPEWHGLAERTDGIVAHLLVAMRERTNVSSLVDTNRWLSVVMPGHSIRPHSDAAEPGWVRRVHVPLTTNACALLTADGTPYHLDVGTAYLFDKTSQHSVANDGEAPRIHLMFEVIDTTQVTTAGR